MEVWGCDSNTAYSPMHLGPFDPESPLTQVLDRARMKRAKLARKLESDERQRSSASGQVTVTNEGEETAQVAAKPEREIPAWRLERDARKKLKKSITSSKT